MLLRQFIIGMTLIAAFAVAGCNKQQQSSPANTTGDNTPNSTNMTSDAATSEGSRVSDGVITTKVKSALLADSTVKALDINVDTKDGNVKLSGTVDNPAQIDSAVKVAKSVEGVKNVDNQLKAK